MPTIAGRTREQLRVSVGWHLMGSEFHLGTTTSEVDSASVLDTALQRGNDDFNGWWERQTSGTNDGETRLVTDYVAATGDLTVVAHGASVASGVTFELWRPEFHPNMADEFLMNALLDTYGHTYDPVESLALHAARSNTRFPAPSTLDIINRILYRASVQKEDIHQFERLFDQATDANFTQTVDTLDFRRGSSSLKIALAVGATLGEFIADGFTARDLSDMTHIEGWVKCSATLAAGDWVIHLDDGDIVGGTSDLENLNLPAAGDSITGPRRVE